MTRDNKELVAALEIFGESYIAELGNQLRKADKKATGDLIQSLDSRVIKTAMGTLYTIELKAKDYLKYVDSGRRAGTYPPLNAIKKWARIKGIPKEAVFPIMKKIKEQGIKPTHVISKTLKIVRRGAAYRKFEEGAADWVDDLMGQMLLDISKNNNITVRQK